MGTKDNRAAGAETRAPRLDPSLVLKASPPRLPKGTMVRPRLALASPRFSDAALIVVQAPGGFGKTSLLGQWRRESLANGATTLWLTLDALDDVSRIVDGLFTSIGVAGEHRAFRRGRNQWSSESESGLARLTGWLAGIAETAADTLLILDDVDAVSSGALEQTLPYILRNAPANLRVIVSSRGQAGQQLLNTASGSDARVNLEDLRFDLAETSTWLRSVFGERIDADGCARLHELTEGWPLGLKLAAATIGERSDVREAIQKISARSRDFDSYFVESLIAGLPVDEAAFLIRIAAVDLVHPQLCAAVTQHPDAAGLLASLARRTPIFIESTQADWMRIHPLARQFLHDRFTALPDEEQHSIHERAARWLADHHMYEEAARHALRIRQHAMAWEFAERSLYAVTIRGDSPRVLEWVERLPTEEIERRPKLRVAVGWSLAVCDRHEAARALIEPILADEDADASLQFESAMIASTAAFYADAIDRSVALMKPWIEKPPASSPLLLAMLSNQRAMIELTRGAPELARHVLSQAPDYGPPPELDYIQGFTGWITGLSYLWEGQATLAADSLTKSLQRAELDRGRRSPVAVLLATAAAAASWDCNRLDAAALALADRLDAIERLTAPESIAMGYVCAARIALADGQERRAIDLLETLHALGEARGMPRLRIAGLAEQMRIHSARGRAETCAALLNRLAKASPPDQPRDGLTARVLGIGADVARAYAAIAHRGWQTALDLLGRAAETAESLRRGRDAVQIRMLRAIALRGLGNDADDLMREAISLADALGLHRLAKDTHPGISSWSTPLQTRPAAVEVQSATTRIAADRRTVTQAGLLTPKEREILDLLARGLSNKQIALTMNVSEETVKWHLKNLFGKLNAGTRDHLVNRARMLGLLDVTA